MSTRDCGVWPEKGGPGQKYWYAIWRDETGKRRSKSLGNVNKISKREALVRCREIAAGFVANPSGKATTKAPLLGEWTKRYIDDHPDYAEGTKRVMHTTRALLVEYFGADTRLDRVTPNGAKLFRESLARRQGQGDDAITENTLRKHMRQSKRLFNEAIDRELIPANPFKRIKSSPVKTRSWTYVGEKATTKILDACPDEVWRRRIALCRWAGLRIGEAMILKWTDINWQDHTMRVTAPKTMRSRPARTVPIEPRLYQLLLQGFNAAATGEVTVAGGSTNNLRRAMLAIIKRAGVAEYSKPFHTLRKSLETDWMASHPVPAVASWLGHSIAVAMAYYTQVLPEQYRQVTGIGAPAMARAAEAA